MRSILNVPAARRYGLATLSVAAALGLRMALEPAGGGKWPFLLFAIAVLVAARFGGLGPGLVATGTSLLAVWYFLLEPRFSFAIADSRDIGGLFVFAVAGAAISLLSEQLRQSLAVVQTEAAGCRQATERLAETQLRTNAILESISGGFNAFDREWRCTCVNVAGAKLVGKTPGELLGRTLWELWPHAFDSGFGVACRRAVEENVPAVVEAFYSEPLNAWFEVRGYPSPEGLSLFFTDTTERKRAEERLRLLESATSRASDGILIVKVSGETAGCQNAIFVNPAFEQMTGCGLQDLREGAVLPFTDTQLVDAKNTRFERSVARKDGTEFWAELSAEPIGNGTCTHCVWTVRDITERRQAAETARRLSSMVESSDDAIFSETPGGIVLSWNQGAVRIYGYSADEMIGQLASVLQIPGVPNGHLSMSEEVERSQADRIRKDGRQIVAALTVSPIRDESGKVVAGSVVARDITEQNRAQEALRLSEERYRSLVSATAQIVWTANAQGDVVEDSSAWSAFTGLNVTAARGGRWADALHPEDRGRVVANWANAVKRQSHYSAEYRVRRCDGQYRHLSVHGVPVLEKDGTIREWVGTSTDITDTRLAEEEVRRLNADLESRVVERTVELEAANKELEAFAYSVSHDLRAPLRAVDGFSRILLEEYAPQLPAEAQHYLEVARRNAVQMGELIDNLLAFSRLGRQPVRKQLVAPSDLARQAWEDLGGERQGRTVEIVFGDLLPCEADPLLLKQVFANLLSNAQKYTRTRKMARIELGSSRLADFERGDAGAPPPSSADGAAVVYTIRDNGVGFDMRYADKLFGVFQRLHRAEEYEGTGIGLANVQRLIHKHGGSVWAWGEVDRGAAFYFSLPGVGRNGGRPAANEQEQLPS